MACLGPIISQIENHDLILKYKFIVLDLTQYRTDASCGKAVIDQYLLPKIMQHLLYLVYIILLIKNSLQVCLCSIPFLVILFISNVMIGQATLTEIPEGYEPEHWEYFKHPVSRYIFNRFPYVLYSRSHVFK